jgi:hypothetical protein
MNCQSRKRPSCCPRFSMTWIDVSTTMFVSFRLTSIADLLATIPSASSGLMNIFVYEFHSWKILLISWMSS